MLRTRSWVADGSSPASASALGQRALRRPARSAPELHVGPGGQLEVAVAELGGRRAERRQLVRREPPAGQPDPRQPAVGRGVHPQRPGAGVGTAPFGGGGGRHEADTTGRHLGVKLAERAGSAAPAPAVTSPTAVQRSTRRQGGGSRCESGAVPPLSPGSGPQHEVTAQSVGGKTGASTDPGARTLRSPRPTTRGADPEEGQPCPAPPPIGDPRVILLLSTSDTDLLSARASGADYRLANPARLGVDDLPALLDGVDLVVVRILGGRRAWEDGLDALLAGPRPVVVLGGEQAPDAELMELSTVPGGVVRRGARVPRLRRPGEPGRSCTTSSPTPCCSPATASPRPRRPPTWGLLERTPRPHRGPDRRRPLLPRAPLAGNTAFVEALCDAIEDAGGQAAAGVLRLAAHRRARAARRARARPTRWS